MESSSSRPFFLYSHTSRFYFCCCCYFYYFLHTLRGIERNLVGKFSFICEIDIRIYVIHTDKKAGAKLVQSTNRQTSPIQLNCCHFRNNIPIVMPFKI